MAIIVMNWVLEEAPDLPSHCFGVLMALASKASEDGTGAYPSQSWLAKRARKTTRQVRKDLTNLEELKLIRRGDQSLVAHLPADERPVVWDLTIERTRDEVTEPDGPKSADQEKHTRDRNPSSARNHTSGRNWGSGGERNHSSAYTSFDRSFSSPSEKRDTRARAKTTVEGDRLLQEHLAACRLRPAKDLVIQTREQINKLLEESHIGADHVRAGLALLRAKPQLSPRLLPNLVFEAANRQPPNANLTLLRSTGTDGRYMPGSGSQVPARDDYDPERFV